MSLDNLPVEWCLTDWVNITSTQDGFKRGPFGGSLKKEMFVSTGYAVYEQYAPINDDCTRFRYFIDEDKYQELEKFSVEENDFLISCSGTMGRITQVPVGAPKGVINQALLRIRLVKDAIDSRYFLYLFKSPEFQNEILSGAVGGAIVNLASVKELKEIKIPLPPIAEQQEIVRQLDVMLAQVEQIKARLDAIPAILKKFRQSVLADAVSGKLTEEWRSVNPILESASETKEKWLAQRREKFNEQYPKKKFKEPSLVDDKYMPWDEIPNDWDLVSVSEFAECLDNLRVPIKKDDRNSNEGLYPYFGANGEVDRVDEFIIDDDIVLVTEDETFYGRTKPIAYRYYGKCWVNNHVHVLKAPTREANDYLCYALMYYHVIPWLTGTTGRAKLSQAALNSLPLLMPPVKEIEVIVANVNKLLERAEKIENVIQSAQKRVNLLTQSILAKAFSGELTAEWREQHQDLITGVNSAESLLAKIQAEREASKPVKKTRVRKAK